MTHGSTASSGPADAVIVGAGMAGIAAARAIRAAGRSVIVLDKGRAPGGRMATRRIDGASFDHGAQHFSVRSGSFRSLVDDLVRDGVVREWFRSASLTRPERGVEVRHAGVDGMRGVVTHLAEGLDVRTGVTVERFRFQEGNVVATAGGSEVVGRALVLTPPLPQSLRLLEASHVDLRDEPADRFRTVRYDPCLAVMAALDGPSGLEDGHLAVNGEVVAWIADNQHKGISRRPAVTIHGAPGFSATHLDEDPAQWVAALLAGAADHVAAGVVSATGHRWRYAQPAATLDSGCAVIDGPGPVVLAGEVFAGARVEGAYLSGEAAGAAVLARLG